MPELRSGVRRGRASRNPNTANNNTNQEIGGQKLTTVRTRGRRGGGAAVRGRGRRNNRQPVAAVEVQGEGDEKVLEGEAVEVDKDKTTSLKRNEAEKGGEGEGGVREVVGEKEMDEFDSGGNAVGRSGDRLNDDDAAAPLPEKVYFIIDGIILRFQFLCLYFG